MASLKHINITPLRHLLTKKCLRIGASRMFATYAYQPSCRVIKVHKIITKYTSYCSHRTLFQSTIKLQDKSEKIELIDNEQKPGNLKRTGQLAKVFAEYGTTAIVFHTTLSLTSLGISYTAVSSGIDVASLLQYFNLISEATTEAKIAGGAGTFVIAYACHKVFMPVRIFLTVTCTPIIVRKLRSMGFLKDLKKKSS